MKSKYFFLLFLTLSFIGCRKDAELSQTQRQTNAVQLTLSAMSDSLRTKGLTGWIPFLLKSPDFTWEFQGSRLTYDSLTSQIQREAILFRSINLTWDSVEVKYQSFSEATLFAKYTEAIVDTNGRSFILSGHVTSRLVKVSGLWRFRSGETYTDLSTPNR